MTITRDSFTALIEKNYYLIRKLFDYSIRFERCVLFFASLSDAHDYLFFAALVENDYLIRKLFDFN